MPQTNLSTLIDSFGDLKADAADIEVKQQDIKNALADLPKGAYEGERYRLNVIEADVERLDLKAIMANQATALENAIADEKAGEAVDWKKIAMRLIPSRQLLDAHTSKTMQRSLRIGARNGKKVAA